MYKGFILILLMVFSVSVVQADESIEGLILRAEQGDSNAQHRLATRYQAGFEVDKNDKEAANWFKKAALQGNPLAQEQLGKAYLEGKGVEQSDERAHYWLEKAYKQLAMQGNVSSQYALGKVYYDRGSVDPKNLITALAWILLGRDNLIKSHISATGKQITPIYLAEESRYRDIIDNLVESMTLDQMSEAEKLSKKIAQQIKRVRVKELTHLAQLGDIDAYYQLGRLHNDETGYYKDAFRFFTKAAKQGHTLAQYELGKMYLSVFTDEGATVQAIHWLEKAAKKGHVPAQIQLGDLYISWRRGMSDKVKAYAWWSLVAPNDLFIKERRDGLTKSMSRFKIYKAKKLAKKLAKEIEQNKKLASESKASGNNLEGSCGGVFGAT